MCFRSESFGGHILRDLNENSGYSDTVDDCRFSRVYMQMRLVLIIAEVM